MDNFQEYEKYDGLDLANLIRNGEISASELLETAIQRVETRNPQINAVIMKLYDLGKQTIDAGLPKGIFTGVPYLIKDLAASIKGVATTRASRFFANSIPITDSEHIKRLKQSGLVIFGKTNTCELGLSLTCEPRMYGPTFNPWDLDRISGGSSGGSAAAVSARMLPMAHASDGFGSIRVPAACCGLVGLKPTRNRNTMAPYLGEGLGGLAVEHAVTISVRDCAALLDVTSGPGVGDPYVAPTPNSGYLDSLSKKSKSLRIAFTKNTPNGVKIDSEPLRVLEETAKLCFDLGHDVEESDPQIDGTDIVPTFLKLMATNTVVNLSSYSTSLEKVSKDEVEKITWACYEMGKKVTGADYVRAIQTCHRLGRQMATFHNKYDILLTPTIATLPVKHQWLDMMMEDFTEYWDRIFSFSPFTVLFNMTGQPAITLPLGETKDNLPVGVQIVSSFGNEISLFQLAKDLEEASPWFERKPQFFKNK